MRLWSIHPSYLDGKGLVALWREGLLARAVIRGRTIGYRDHPQLDRFRAHPAPLSAINSYLSSIASEAEHRGYDFDRSRIGPVRNRELLRVSRGQLEYELKHLRAKLSRRAPECLGRLPAASALCAHPLFEVHEGPVATWERVTPPCMTKSR